MQAPGDWLCVCTILLLRPNGGLNGPVNPAAVQAARAFATVIPTRFGTTKQPATGVGAGVGVGVGPVDGVDAGVGSGVGAGDGVGLDPVVGFGVAAGGDANGVGGDVGPDVGDAVPTPGRGVGVALEPPPGDVAFEGGVALALADVVPSGAGSGVSSIVSPPVTTAGEAGAGTPARSD